MANYIPQNIRDMFFQQCVRVELTEAAGGQILSGYCGDVDVTDAYIKLKTAEILRVTGESSADLQVITYLIMIEDIALIGLQATSM